MFLVECYAPASVTEASTAAADRVAAACAELRPANAGVVYLGALMLPDDEVAFHVFRAANASAALEASGRAGLRVERVVQGVAICLGSVASARRQALPVGDEVERPVAHAPGEIGP